MVEATYGVDLSTHLCMPMTLFLKIAISVHCVHEMLKLVHMCTEFLIDELDLPIDCCKCNFRRVGLRFNSKCAPIYINIKNFEW